MAQVGMRVTIDEAKGNFFDIRSVTDPVERARVRNLSRLGSFIRTRALSILLGHTAPRRFGKRSKITNRVGISAPNHPPNLHQGDLARFLFFGYDPETGSTVIGPALYRRVHSTLDALEQGGSAAIRRGIYVRGQKIGERTVQAQFRARPFMRPALEAERERSAKLWEDSIK